LATVKKGLNIDPDNSQLRRQLRAIKAKRADAKRADARRAAIDKKKSAAGPRPEQTPLTREIIDLQEQYVTSSREFNTAKAHVAKSRKEQKMHDLTRSELEKLPVDSDARIYRSVGKMFARSSRPEIIANIEKAISLEETREKELEGKIEYFERKMKTQQQNIQDLLKNPTAE